MAEADLKGSTIYRLGFLIFGVACLFNAYDAWTTYVKTAYGLEHGADAVGNMYEALSFLALTLILTFEGVGLIMFKWMKRAVKGIL